MKKNIDIYNNSIRASAILFILIPIVPVVIWSFAQTWNYPDLLPEFSLRAWRQIFITKDIVRAFGTSLMLGIGVTIIDFIIAMPAAKALAVYEFKMKKIVYGFLILPAVIPPITSIMGLQIVFIHIGVINSFGGVLLAHIVPTLPYMILYLNATYKNFDLDFESQAKLLGAGRTERFLHITLPLMRPGIVVAALYTFLVSWSQYLVSVILGGPHIRTLPTLLFSYLTSGDYAISAAVSIVFVLPSLVLLILSSRYIIGLNMVKE